MKGDFSRDTFNRAKRFSRVLQQQGRVQLDADANEQTSILLDYLRTLAADLFGPFAGPAGDVGFQIGPVADGDFPVGTGRYYIDGILCGNLDAQFKYKTQKDFPAPPELVDGTPYVVYLDVWERHISPVEDDSIRETALGGPDTCTRAMVVWQVKIDDGARIGDQPALNPAVQPATLRKEWATWTRRWQPLERGRLKARVVRPEDSNDPCLSAPDAKYRGQENQLYRVEVHQGGDAKSATFKWSRDNGSVSTRVQSLAGAEAVVSSPRGFAEGLWVELSNDAQELRGEPGTLARLVKVQGDRFTFASAPSQLKPVKDEAWPTKVRRWDQPGNGLQVTEGVSNADWIDLENGVQIQFQPAKDGANRYRAGDYWLIPARVATGNIEWPLDGPEAPAAMEPFGVLHHYAPLAILAPDAAPQDCRCTMTPPVKCAG